MIYKFKRKNKELAAKLKCANLNNNFCGGGIFTQLTCRSDKNFILKILQRYIVNWYQTYLLNPGMGHTATTFVQHLYWPSLRYNIRNHIKVCSNCQKNNK